jgi:NAD(P)-dependent dehydrogenase (short-subunit alcohol dehydrogenase family)
MTSLFSLPSGFHAAVIGGAGDIGAAISNLFCDLGASVTATAVDDAAVAHSQLRPRQGLTVKPLDVTNDAAVEAFAQQHERVDALINCAGILARDKEYEIATFMKVLDVNLTGTFRTCLAFRPALSRAKGAIVNIASMNATLALPRIPALRQQGRRRDAHQGAGACLGAGRCSRQRGRAGLHRDQHQ